MQEVKVKIKLFDGGKMPFKETTGAAAFDCYAKEDTEIYPDKPTIVKLGFAIELPKGYCAKLIPRSSTGLKTNIREANGIGLIDEDYRGEVGFIAELKDSIVQKEDKEDLGGGVTAVSYKNVLADKVVIKKHERICQMLIEKVLEVELVQAEELSETERGTGGFGSTGK